MGLIRIPATNYAVNPAHVIDVFITEYPTPKEPTEWRLWLTTKRHCDYPAYLLGRYTTLADAQLALDDVVDLINRNKNA